VNHNEILKYLNNLASEGKLIAFSKDEDDGYDFVADAVEGVDGCLVLLLDSYFDEIEEERPITIAGRILPTEEG